MKTNIGVITEKIKAKLNILRDKEYLLRPICFDVVDLMTKRIHVDGLASDNKPIGTYSDSYMALRTGAFKSAALFKKGVNKGKVKNAGVTRDGYARPNYHRSADPKVVISLTRQLENDWSVIATDKGYGIGFLNALNLQKARWTEETYDKPIFNLTASESDHAIKTVQELIRKAFAS